MLVIFSPVVSGTRQTGPVPETANFAWFPLSNPGLVSIPLGLPVRLHRHDTSKEYNKAKYAEIEVRSLTGVGAEKATEH